MSASTGGIAAIATFMKELNTLDCGQLTITADSRLTEDLGLNSLSILLLVVWIKDNVNGDVFEQVGNVSNLQKVSDVLALMKDAV